jgi:alginate O-acetyltransferase complex protein AlgI
MMDSDCCPPKKLRNVVLLFFSYLFYLYGAAGFLLILILSTLADYVLGRLIDRKAKYKSLWLSFSLLLNLGLLAYFKYANFFVGELNRFILGFKFEGVSTFLYLWRLRGK